MVFHSLAFIFFLFLLVLAYWGLGRSPWLLLGGSYAFYATLAPRFIVLLCVVTVVAYALGLAIDRSTTEQRKLRLTGMGTVGFIALLAFFKYEFLRVAVGELFAGPGAFGPWDLLLPVGMSFYLFKVIGYTVDVFWERIPAERSFAAFATYVSFFPQILSGPIQRPGAFFSQLGSTSLTPELLTSGLRRILFGVLVKVVVANRLAEFVDPVFAAPKDFTALSLAITVYLFAVQLYADFSAVSSIAIGAGRLLGISAPENFDAPFLAVNLPEFWRRWHMSLTSWLTDYVYVPIRHWLRGLGDAGLALAILANMIAVGVWHGERASYLVFGLVNGIFMVLAALTTRFRIRLLKAHPHLLARLRGLLGPIVTFHVVAYSFVLFRASSLGDAADIYLRIFASALHAVFGAPAGLHPWVSVGQGSTAILTPPVVFRLAMLAIGLIVMGLGHHMIRHATVEQSFLSWPRHKRWAIYYAVTGLLLTGNFNIDTYIYAQF